MQSEKVDFGLVYGQDHTLSRGDEWAPGLDRGFANWLIVEYACDPFEAKRYAYRLRTLQNMMNGKGLGDEARAREVLALIYRKDWAKGTIRHHIFTLERYMAYLGLQIKFKKPRQGDRCPDYLTQTQLRALIEAVEGYREYAIIAMFIFTGARLSEVTKMNIGDVDLIRKVIVIHHAKRDKERIIPLSEPLEKVIKAYLSRRPEHEASDPLFVSIRGTRLSSKAMYQIVRKVGLKSGLPNVHPHALRHSFATAWVDNNGDVFHLKDLLGHSDIHMTERYWHLNTKAKTEAFKKAAPRL